MKNKDLSKTVSTFPVFAGFSKESISLLLDNSSVVKHDKGEHIVFHGDESSDVYIVLDGKVRITFYAESGRDVIFRDMEKGEALGVLAAIDELPRSAYVVAQQKVTLLQFSKTTFMDIFHSEPHFGLNLLKHTSGLIRLLTQRLIEFATEKANNRIRLELLRLARENMRDDTWGTIEGAPTHAEIASQIGSHREAVTREMSDLIKAGIIEKQKAKVLVVNVNRMEEMIRMDYQLG